MSDERIHYMQCSRESCRLRFPLDLATSAGAYCPRCGAPLQQGPSRLPSYLPPVYLPAPTRLVGVLDNIRSAYNVGSIFRTASCAGVAKLYCCGISPHPGISAQVAKTALGTEQSQPWSYAPNALDLVQELKQSGMRILALECLEGAEVLLPAKHEKTGDLALLVGNEAAGLDPQLLDLADKILYLPMRGQKSSLNVSCAFSIAAYALLFP